MNNDCKDVYLIARGWKRISKSPDGTGWYKGDCESCQREQSNAEMYDVYKLEYLPFKLCLSCAYTLEKRWFGIMGVKDVS